MADNSDTPPTHPANPAQTVGSSATGRPDTSETAGVPGGARPVWGEPTQLIDDWLAIEPDGTVTILVARWSLAPECVRRWRRSSPRNWMSRWRASVW